MTTPHTSYLICSTPRTGSSLLCDALTGTGVAGRPEEYFQFRARTGFPRRPQEYFEGAGDPEIFDILGPRTGVADVEARYDPSRFERYEQYLDWAVRAGTTPNGVFGAKVMWGYFNGFVTGLRWALPGRRQRLPVPELVQSVFPNLTYIAVSRRDKVRQAVSLWRALQTLVWSRDSDAGEDAPDEQRPVYSYDAIDHLLHQLRRQEDAWRGFFFRIGRRPLQLFYEDIAGDLEGCVGRVLDDLHVERPQGELLARQPLSRQSDDLSESWVQSYLEDVSRR